MELLFSTEDIEKMVETYVRANCNFATEKTPVRVVVDKYGYQGLVKVYVAEKEAA